MATLTIADLDNGKIDLETIEGVANSHATQVNTRYGGPVTTLHETIRRINSEGDSQLAAQNDHANEVISNLGFRVPVGYSSGLDIIDSRVTVRGPDGIIYAPLNAPFVTDTWNPAQWYVLQNDLNDHKLLVFNTFSEASAAAATLPDGQSVQIEADETRDGRRTRNVVHDGALVYVGLAGDAGSIQAGSQTQSGKNEESVSLLDAGGVLGQDATAAIIAALQKTAGAVIVPPGNWEATPTSGDVHSALRIIERIHLIGNLTIKPPDGTHSGTLPAVGNVSGSGDLKIVGATQRTRRSIMGVVGVTGAAGAWNVILQLDSVADIAVGMFLHTVNVTGTGPASLHRGGWPVTAVNAGANQVTVRNSCWLDTFPTTTVTASDTYVIGSVLKFNNCDGFILRKGQIFLDWVAVRGNASDYWLSTNVAGTEKGTHGIYAGGPTVAVNGKLDDSNPYGLSGASFGLGRYVCVYDFDQQGIVTELGGEIFGDFASSCFNRRRGFYVSTASGIRSKHISANGNFLDGVITDIGGQIYASSSSCACGNGSNGVTGSSEGSVIFDAGFCEANKLSGIRSASNGYVQFTGGVAEYNVLDGINGQFGGTIYCDNASVQNNGRNGLFGQSRAKFRATGANTSNNGAFGVRSDDGAFIFATTLTNTGNASGSWSVTRGGQIVIDSTVYGGTVYGDLLRSKNVTTGNGIQLATTSGGDAATLGFDRTASQTYTTGYTFSNNSSGFYPSDNGVKLNGRPGNSWNNVHSRNVTLTPPASVTPVNNGEVTFELTSDTQLKVKVKGSDGIVRSASLTLT